MGPMIFLLIKSIVYIETMGHLEVTGPTNRFFKIWPHEAIYWRERRLEAGSNRTAVSHAKKNFPAARRGLKSPNCSQNQNQEWL